MREYPRPTIAARVLEDAAASPSSPEDTDWFLCDADGVGFEGAVPAVRDVELLRAGQIYFVLPVSTWRRGLRREEVAALAVRASAALSSRASASAAPGKRRRGAVVAPLVFAPRPSEEDERLAAACKAAAAAPPVRWRVRSGKRLGWSGADGRAQAAAGIADERSGAGVAGEHGGRGQGGVETGRFFPTAILRFLGASLRGRTLFPP